MNMSSYEDKIVKILNKEKVSFQREFTFPHLTYKKHSLRFDFCLKINNETILIEVQGLQHYKPNNFFKNFRHMQENDRRKIKYCLLNNIKLYCIPYWNVDKIKTVQELFKDEYLATNIYHNDQVAFNYFSGGNNG